MAGRELIHFPFWAQLSSPPLFPVLSPPEPVAESPPYLKIAECIGPSRSDFDCRPTPVPQQIERHT